MRHISKALLLFILVCFTGMCARANHIFGVDFYYEHVSGNTYKVNLVIYADCIAMNYSLLRGAIPKVQVRNGNTTVATMQLTQQGSDVDVTPVCAAEKNNTQCSNPNSTIPGVGRFTYTGTYTLSGTSANWHFYFDGDLSSPANPMHRAGRATNITNISGGSVIAMDCFLNNVNGPNSSPTFTTLPTPYFCNNVAQQNNPGAVDINNDSLVYALIPGLNSTFGGGGATVNYVGSASATAPLTTATGAFSFSSSTGQISFTPNAVQRSLVVEQVNEYRNGVLVGTAVREMTFVVLGSCNNAPASSVIDTNASAHQSAVRSGANAVNICYGSSISQFVIRAVNPSADTIDASVNGLPTGATATITQNSTPDPIITISWNQPNLLPGSYNFFVAFKDNGCPLSSVQTQAFTVTIVRPYSISSTILAPTQCFHKATIGFNLAFGVTPRNVTISQNGTTVAQHVDNTGSFTDSLVAGIYNVLVSSPTMPCSTSYSLRVVDSGVYPNIPQADTAFYCLNDPAVALVAVPDSGATLSWYNVEGKHLAAAPIPKTDSAGVFYWLVGQKMKVCNSPTDTVTAFVTKRPVADFKLPANVCEGDTATIVFSGAIGVGPILDYNWNWGDGLVQSGQDQGPWRIYWYSPGTKTIKLTVSENKCSSFETTHTLVVRPNPYAGFNVGESTCEHDTLSVTYNSKPFAGQTYKWSFQDADTSTATGPGPYLLRWHSSGIKVLKLTVDLDGCMDTRSAEVTIHPAPDARILNAPGPVCIGDKINLKADGGVSYAWTPKDSVLTNDNGELYSQILKPTTYRVYVTSDFGCVDSAAISYNDVEPCCQFSYPNAFTPNGDGRNDRFRIVTYGNQQRYELSIYNNWGQRVYYGLDPQEGWDGNFKGKPCEPGTYFYYLNATCFTGKQESHHGDLMLVR